MDAFLTEHKFCDFGIDSLYPFSRSGLSSIEGDCPSALREQVLRYLPRRPGVYGMVDVLGRLIYVGKSKALRNRLLSYFLPGNEEDKSGRIVQSTASIVWECQPNEFAALLREQSLIRTFQPRFNVQGIPRRQQQVFVCLGRAPAEQLYVSRIPDPAAVAIIGPLSGAERANRAVEVLNRIFRLRDCSTKQSCSFTEQLQLFEIELRPGCIRLELGTCLGPCIANCSRQQYDTQVAKARQFLAGTDATALETLQASLRQAAQQQQYEQAARIHQDLRAITWLCHRAEDVATARQRFTFVYSVADETGRRNGSIWYLIRRGVIEGAVAAPRNAAQAAAIQPLLAQWWLQPNLVGSSFVSRPETLALVASWFRMHRAELKQAFPLNSDGTLPINCWQNRSARVCAS